jgi:opacity protein-like surface antigen
VFDVPNSSKESEMLFKSRFVCLLLLALPLVSHAQDNAKAEVFGGYQYLHANSGVSGVSSLNLNGWNAAVNGYFTHNLGVTADFSGTYGTPSVLGVGVKTRFYTFLFGPVVRFPISSRLTPFGHVLFGGGHISGEAMGASASETDFTWAAGGGLDANLNRSFAVRLAQADFVQIHSSGQTQNSFRFSAGVVLKF